MLPKVLVVVSNEAKNGYEVSRVSWTCDFFDVCPQCNTMTPTQQQPLDNATKDLAVLLNIGSSFLVQLTCDCNSHVSLSLQKHACFMHCFFMITSVMVLWGLVGKLLPVHKWLYYKLAFVTLKGRKKCTCQAKCSTSSKTVPKP